MKKPNVVILRGSSLNSWEMQNYAPLVKDFNLLAVGTQQSGYNQTKTGFPVMNLLALSDLRSFFGPFKKFPVLNRFGDRFLNLDKILSSADIVHSAETFNVYSHQAAQLKTRYAYKLVLTIWENIPFLWNGVGKNSEKVHHRKQEVIFATDHFIAITKRAKAALLLEGVPEEKISVISMGIDVQRFVPQKKDEQLLKRYNLSPQDLVILSVGHLSWYKGMQELIFAAGRLKKQGLVNKYNLRFVIVGKGPERNEIYSLIRRVGVEDIFRTIEYVPYEDMVKMHNLADIFYLGSRPAKVWQEQFGMVLVESMACGKTVIAAKSGSISEVVENAGVYFPTADFYQLSEVFRDLIQDKLKRAEMGIKGRKRAEEFFASEKAAEEICKIYKQVLMTNNKIQMPNQ